MKKLREFLVVTVDFFSGVTARRIGTYAAAGAFYTFLAIIPLAIILCSLLPFTPLTETTLLSFFDDIIPSTFDDVVHSFVSLIYDGSGITLSVSIIVTLWSASRAVMALMRGMSVAYDVERWLNYFIMRLRAMLFMVITLISTIFSLSFLAYGREIFEIAKEKLPENSMWRGVLTFFQPMRYVLVFVLLTLVFLVIYRWTPGKKINITDQWPGAVFTSLAWILFTVGFSVYLTYSDKYGIYGVLGTVTVAMLWMYYCQYFLLIGGYMNNRYAKWKNEKG